MDTQEHAAMEKFGAFNVVELPCNLPGVANFYGDGAFPHLLNKLWAKRWEKLNVALNS